MLKPNYQFEKRQREMEKKKKKAEKAHKKAGPGEASSADHLPEHTQPAPDAGQTGSGTDLDATPSNQGAQ